MLGVDEAPQEAAGRDEEALGPGDSTDSGSDMIGADGLPTADPAEPIDVTLGRDIAHAPIEAADGDGRPDSADDISIDQIFDTDADGIEGLDSPEAVDKGMAPEPFSDEIIDDDEDEDDLAQAAD